MPDIDIYDLFNFLKERENPVIETTLLTAFLDDRDFSYNDNIDKDLLLFQKHFILFHYLYKLKNSLKDKNYILFIKNISIYLFELPEKNFCPHFNEENIRFCLAKKSLEDEFCDYHINKNNDIKNTGGIINQRIDDYYLDLNNLYSTDITKLKKMMQFTINYVNSKEEIDESLKLLGCNIDDSEELVKKKYRIKAKNLHPDLSNKSADEFRTLTDAYNIIINNLHR